jgi:hypothetical protein
MQILSRSDAIAQQRRLYFTGKPCRNGHVAPRYVQSCTCRECIGASVSRQRGGLADPQRDARATYRERTSLIRLRLPLHSLPAVRSIAAGLLASRFPGLAADGRTVFDVEPSPVRKAGGTAMCRFRVHEDDAATLAAIARAECDQFSASNLAAREATP